MNKVNKKIIKMQGEIFHLAHCLYWSLGAYEQNDNYAEVHEMRKDALKSLKKAMRDSFELMGKEYEDCEIGFKFYCQTREIQAFFYEKGCEMNS